LLFRFGAVFLLLVFVVRDERFVFIVVFRFFLIVESGWLVFVLVFETGVFEFVVVSG